MKRLLISLIIALTAVMASTAQAGLNINRVFTGTAAASPEATMTIMSGNSSYLKSHNLTALATFKGPSEKFAKTIEPLVVADATKASGKNLRYKNGHLHYAFFALPPLKSGKLTINRYVYYLDNDSEKDRNITLVYLEGTISQPAASKLIKTLRR